MICVVEFVLVFLVLRGVFRGWLLLILPFCGGRGGGGGGGEEERGRKGRGKC